MSAILVRTGPPALRHARPAVLCLRHFSARPIVPERISEVIKRDHRELEEAYNNIVTSTTTEDKVKWRNQFTWELARHSIGEEILVYPRMEGLFSHGEFLADRDREEHLTVRQALQPSPFESELDTNYLPSAG